MGEISVVYTMEKEYGVPPMPALAELPDGDGEYLPAGNIVPNVETLGGIMRNLHETIVSQLLNKRMCYCEIINGRRVIFQMPPANQLHDFVSFYGEESHAYNVVLMIPSTQPEPDGEYKYDTHTFEYELPKTPPYLDKFSQN